MIPLINFTGHWYSEPSNTVKIYVNLNHVIYVAPYGKDHYQMIINRESDKFIVHESEVTIVDANAGDEENWAANVLMSMPNGDGDAS